MGLDKYFVSLNNFLSVFPTDICMLEKVDFLPTSVCIHGDVIYVSDKLMETHSSILQVARIVN